MPTVEADVAFGLGKFNMAKAEIMSKVAKALNAVGMYEYMQVSQSRRVTLPLAWFRFHSSLTTVCTLIETSSNSQRWSETKGCHSWGSGRSL